MFRIAMVRAHVLGSPLLGNPETEGGGTIYYELTNDILND